MEPTTRIFVAAILLGYLLERFCWNWRFILGAIVRRWPRTLPAINYLLDQTMGRVMRWGWVNRRTWASLVTQTVDPAEAAKQKAEAAGQWHHWYAAQLFLEPPSSFDEAGLPFDDVIVRLKKRWDDERRIH